MSSIFVIWLLFELFVVTLGNLSSTQGLDALLLAGLKSEIFVTLKEEWTHSFLSPLHPRSATDNSVVRQELVHGIPVFILSESSGGHILLLVDDLLSDVEWPVVALPLLGFPQVVKLDFVALRH